MGVVGDLGLHEASPPSFLDPGSIGGGTSELVHIFLSSIGLETMTVASSLCSVSAAVSRQHLDLCSGIAFSPQNRYLCTIFFHLTSLVPRLLHKYVREFCVSVCARFFAASLPSFLLLHPLSPGDMCKCTCPVFSFRCIGLTVVLKSVRWDFWNVNRRLSI